MAPAVEQEPVIDKQPIKWMELPIMKFNQEAVPHHVNRLKTLKTNIQKCQLAGDWSGAHREQVNANVVVKQLRTLVKEMDLLRSRVIDEDVHKFDKMINISRESALNILQEYIDLSHKSSSLADSDTFHRNISAANDIDNYDNDSNIDARRRSIEYVNGEQLQVHQTLEISRLAGECHDQERCAIAWENLQKDIEEVQQLYQELASIVQTQEEGVTHIENNLGATQEHVEQGERELLRAARLKVASYPLTGALIGSIMGGPVGVIAGFKMGGIVALACGILGYAGGKFLKHEPTDRESHEHSS